MLLLKGKTLIGKFWSRANILISDSGFIVKIFRSERANRFYMSKVDKIYNAQDKLILPGLIDVHVHFRDPGQTHKEDFESGSKCALASGIVVVGDMPNNVPPIDNVESYLRKIEEVSKKSYVDFFLYIMVIGRKKFSDFLRRGVQPRAVKIYLPERRDYDLMRQNDLPRDPIYVFHAEHPGYIGGDEPTNMEDLLKIRPVKAEVEGIRFAINFASRGHRVHITHVSSKAGIEEIINAKRRGLRISCDVTPHHLIFYRERIDMRSPLFKVLPPIRHKHDRDFLIRALSSGVIDIIASDHAPHTIEEKTNFVGSPYGIQSIQYLLPLVFSLCMKLHIDFRRILPLLSRNPARIFGIHRRGWIKVGNYADLVVFDPRRRWVIDPDMCFSKARISPYDFMFVRGYVDATFLRGELVYENGLFLKRIGKLI